MKKKIFTFACLLSLIFCIRPLSAAAYQNGVFFSGEASVREASCRVTISYNGNGGTGSMQNQQLESGVPAKLAANAFSRTGAAFAGWNTKADGTGSAYANLADAAQFVTAANNGKTVVLYAQWKIDAPKVKKMTSKKPGILNVTFEKNSQADGYEMQYALNNKFSKALTIKVNKGASSQEIADLVPGKNYFVRMRSYNGTSNTYGDWSGAKKKKVKKGFTIVNAKSDAAIEADVTLSGSGTGYHAKLVMCTPLSAVSFGIQYDKYAVAPYTGKAMALIENVASNNAGGQSYSRPGNKSLKLKKTYHMMLTMTKNGKGAVYLDYKKIGSFSNRSMAKQDVALRIEGSARLNGDTVKAVFKNVKLKKSKKYDPDRKWGIQEFKLNKTLKGKKKNETFTLSGRISGLPAGGDWDNCYDKVSEIVQFN